MTLRLIAHRAAEDEASAEYRYLHELLLSRARAVFGEVEEIAWTSDAPVPRPMAPAGVIDYVLLLGPGHVWLTSETLRRLRGAVDGGAPFAAPAAIADRPLDEPLYTARDFEAVEAALVDGPGPAASHLPVSLWGAEAFASAAGALPVATVFAGAPLDRPASGASAGLMLVFSDYYGETRDDLLPFLPATAEAVLEVGCGRGGTGALIQARLGCRVTGVEQHPGIAADAARRLHRVIVGDVLTVDLDGDYDVVVASELFEHLVDPDAFLRKIRRHLRPGGRIVLSVPNVGHYSVVEDLIAGRWDYVPAGLLCYTHVRFFTAATLREWIARAGFAGAIVPQTTELPARFDSLPAAFAADRDSLRTRGFYVVLWPAGADPIVVPGGTAGP